MTACGFESRGVQKLNRALHSGILDFAELSPATFCTFVFEFSTLPHNSAT